MVQRKATRFIQSVIYRLKRQYGFPLTLHKIISVDRDLDTGDQRNTIRLLTIKRAVLLPTSLMRRFIYDPAYLKSNKNFTTGGTFDPNNREILLDYEDVGEFNIEIDDYIIYDDKRWQVTMVSELEYKTAFVIEVCEGKGSPVEDLLKPSHTLNLTQAASGEIL